LSIAESITALKVSSAFSHFTYLPEIRRSQKLIQKNLKTRIHPIKNLLQIRKEPINKKENKSLDSFMVETS